MLILYYDPSTNHYWTYGTNPSEGCKLYFEDNPGGKPQDRRCDGDCTNEGPCGNGEGEPCYHRYQDGPGAGVEVWWCGCDGCEEIPEYHPEP